MRHTTHALLLATLLLTLTSSATFAQDRFGSSVATSGDEVWVLKSGSGLGPAALLRYTRDGAKGWVVAERIEPAAAREAGEGLGASLALENETLLIGSADPAGRWGAHVFHRISDGSWTEMRRWPLSREPDPEATIPPAPLDRRAVFRILRPPRRIVVLRGDRAALGIQRGFGGEGKTGVRMLRRGLESDEWTDDGWIPDEDSDRSDGFPAALALLDGALAVGDPGSGCSGAVWMFGRDRVTEDWRRTATLRPSGSDCHLRFGASVVTDGERLLIGAPGTKQEAGFVTVWRADSETGEWSERSRVAAPTDEKRAQFGAALAVRGDELWIGAPGADDGRGAVYRFHRSDGSGGWEAGAEIVAPGRKPGFRFGSAVALGEREAVVGAPGADGETGRAAVFDRTEGGEWTSPQWLTPGLDLSRITGAKVPCAAGMAKRFECNEVDLLAFLPPEALGGEKGEGLSDLWGWTDPQTRREYALVGRAHAVSIVDITDPAAPVHVGDVPANESHARDLKVYRDHLFFTGDGAGKHGMLVFDLTRLRGVSGAPVTFEPDARYEEIGSAHNLAIDTESGFAYIVGASGGGRTCGGGLHMVDIRDPLHPTFAGCYTDTEGVLWKGRTHDTQCVVYRGPDAKYRGRQICFASNESALRIVDVTDKAHPQPLSASTYPNLAYVHQGWLTEDQRYFFLDDEIDELTGRTSRTRTLIWDVTDLEDPVFVREYFGPGAATDHNLYIKGDRMYQANYQAGLRVIDISDPENPVEVGFFDTTPYGANPPGFSGAWTAFPFFDSGTVIVSSMQEGLFVLQPRRALVP